MQLQNVKTMLNMIKGIEDISKIKNNCENINLAKEGFNYHYPNDEKKTLTCQEWSKGFIEEMNKYIIGDVGSDEIGVFGIVTKMDYTKQNRNEIEVTVAPCYYDEEDNEWKRIQFIYYPANSKADPLADMTFIIKKNEKNSAELVESIKEDMMKGIYVYKCELKKRITRKEKRLPNIFKINGMGNKCVDQLIEDCKNVFEEIEGAKENEENAFNDYENYKAQVQKQIEGFSSTLKSYKDQLEVLEFLGYFEEKRDFEEIKESIHELKKQGIRSDKTESSDDNPAGLNSLVECLKQYARTRENGPRLYYSDDVLRQFIGATLSGQIIVLSGPTGTGKTSLPCVAADAFGGVCHRISVQTNWTDEQDLLGFYNVREDRFVPTEFLDALLAAEEDPGHIHYILLDEMNLTRVEYYLAKYLSAMEMEKGKQNITLYSSVLWNNKKTIIRKKIDELQSRLKEVKGIENGKTKKPPKGSEAYNRYEEFKRKLSDEQTRDLAEIEWLVKYPSEITIPENVQIVGTINMDETTKNLSPKVLDRSYVIEIQKFEHNSTATEKETDPVVPMRVTPSIFEGLKKENAGDETVEQINKIIKTSQKQTGKQLLRTSSRAEKHIREISSRYGEAQKALYDVLLCKVLPPINYSDIDKDQWDKVAEQIQILIKDKTLKAKLQKKLELMYDAEMQTASFWRG